MTAVAVLTLAFALAAVHGYVLTLDARARDASQPLAARSEAAAAARRLEPRNERVAVTAAIVEAQRLLAAERVDDAYELLLPYTTTVRGDELFRTTYQSVLKAKWPLDARKAHQQHAKEDAGGGLDPEDVFR